MKSLFKAIGATSILAICSAIPMIAQIDNSMLFTTDFAFYAQNAKMPAGSYRITQADFDSNELLIESTDGKYSAFVDFIPTDAAQQHEQSAVTFHKYGSVEYLNRIWVNGQQYGMKLDPTKSEKQVAKAGDPIEHSVPGSKKL